MERYIQADNAFIKWMEAMSKNVVHIADAWYAAVKWADKHPQWIPVEERLPEKDGKQDSLVQDIRDWIVNKCDTYPDYYDNEIIAAALGQVAKEYGYEEE